jgi:hypothetical protein
MAGFTFRPLYRQNCPPPLLRLFHVPTASLHVVTRKLAAPTRDRTPVVQLVAYWLSRPGTYTVIACVWISVGFAWLGGGSSFFFVSARRTLLVLKCSFMYRYLWGNNMVRKVRSFRYTDISKASFTPRHVGRSCTAVVKPNQTWPDLVWPDVLTAVTVKMAVVWVVAPCRLVHLPVTWCRAASAQVLSFSLHECDSRSLSTTSGSSSETFGPIKTKCVIDRQTDRHGRVHKVFSHAWSEERLKEQVPLPVQFSWQSVCLGALHSMFALYETWCEQSKLVR